MHTCTVKYFCTLCIVCIYVCIEECGQYVLTIRSVLSIAMGAFNGDPIASVVIPTYDPFSTIRSSQLLLSIIIRSLLSLSVVVRSVTYLDPTAFPSSTAIEYAMMSTPTIAHTYIPSGPLSMISTTSHSLSTTALLQYFTTAGDKIYHGLMISLMVFHLYVCMYVCMYVNDVFLQLLSVYLSTIQYAAISTRILLQQYYNLTVCYVCLSVCM